MNYIYLKISNFIQSKIEIIKNLFENKYNKIFNLWKKINKLENNYNINGRKIPIIHENPIDNYIILLCDYCINFCIKYNITPNNITITRIILSFIIYIYLYYSSYKYIPICGIGLFYFMDCLDGHLARLSNQVTILGDYLDHCADIFFYFNFLIFILFKTYYYKYYIIFGFIILTYFALIHLSLQQQNYKLLIYRNLQLSEQKYELKIEKPLSPKSVINIDNSEILDKLKYLHNFTSSNIIWSRYFGTGTLYLVILILVYWIQTNKLNYIQSKSNIIYYI